MQVPLQCLCPNIVHASVLKVSYMCLDTSAGTSGNRGGARPSFRMRGPICAGPYLMPPKLLCSLLRQLMWRYRATTYLIHSGRCHTPPPSIVWEDNCASRILCDRYVLLCIRHQGAEPHRAPSRHRAAVAPCCSRYLACSWRAVFCTACILRGVQEAR